MFQRDLITNTLLAAVCAAAIAHAHSAGTTQVAAGVPGEGNCVSCHTVGPTGDGGVVMTFPNSNITYQAGVSQHLKVTITDSTAKRWGFQLTARLHTNSQLQGGTFTPGTDSQLFCTNIGSVNYSLGSTCPSQQPLSYLEHTYDGTHINTTPSGKIVYEFDWTPPSDNNAGNVIFYVAGLASNNDGGVGGDITYLNRYIVTPATLPDVPVISSIQNVSGIQSTITSGAQINIRGSGLAPKSRSIGPSELINGQYPSTADGVQVTIAGVPAYITALDPARISVIVPKTDALGIVNVQVTNGSQTGAAYTADLETVAPAFMLSSPKYVLAVHLDGTAVGPATPAQPGETIVLTSVGLGVANPPVDPGIVATDTKPSNLVETPLVLFNGLGTLAQGAVLVPGLAGVFGVTVQVPSDVPDGDALIQIQVSGVQSDTGFYLAVKR